MTAAVLGLVVAAASLFVPRDWVNEEPSLGTLFTGGHFRELVARQHTTEAGERSLCYIGRHEAHGLAAFRRRFSERARSLGFASQRVEAGTDTLVRGDSSQVYVRVGRDELSVCFAREDGTTLLDRSALAAPARAALAGLPLSARDVAESQRPGKPVRLVVAAYLDEAELGAALAWLPENGYERVAKFRWRRRSDGLTTEIEFGQGELLITSWASGSGSGAQRSSPAGN